MRKFLLAVALVAAPSSLRADPGKAVTPNDIVDAAPASDWVDIAPEDIIVLDLGPNASGRPGRVIIQLIAAPFSQGWTGNIRKLVSAHWFDGTAIVRVQDNYVVQWGDPEGETPGKAKPLPAGLTTVPEAAYTIPVDEAPVPAADDVPGTEMRDAYVPSVYFHKGWPVGAGADNRVAPLHCYGMVGVGRNLSPDTGSGAELYAVIGQAPRQLDRNIALVGRVIAGMEHLSALPRGTGPLGFYETPQERTPIVSVRMGGEVRGLPTYQYLSAQSASFAAYVHKRANRKDKFYVQPAGGVDICNVPVPIREARK